MLKAYVFDFAGTLVDFQCDLDARVKATKVKLEEIGFSKERLKMINSYAELYNEAIIDALMRRVDLPASKVREAIGEVFDFWDGDAATRWQLRENAQETLSRLPQEATVGLYSAVGHKTVMTLLQKYEIDKFFHIVITRNDTILIKPYDDGLRLILGILKIPPDEMLFIGDSAKDVAAAKGIGARSAYIADGEEELSPEIKPDYVIHSLSEILEIK